MRHPSIYALILKLTYQYPETDLPIAFICKQMNRLTGTYAVYPPFVVFHDTITMSYLTTRGCFTLTIDKQTGEVKKLSSEPNQKTHRDYGLPKIEALPDSSFAEPPKLLPKAE